MRADVWAPVRSLLSNVQPAQRSDQVLRIPPDAARVAHTIRSLSAEILSPSSENPYQLSPQKYSAYSPSADGGYFSLDGATEIVAHGSVTNSPRPSRTPGSPDSPLRSGSRFSTVLKRSAQTPTESGAPFPERDPEEAAALAAASAPLSQAAAGALAATGGPISFSQGGYVHLGPPSGSESEQGSAGRVRKKAAFTSLSGSAGSPMGSDSARAGSSGVEASGEASSSSVSMRSNKSVSSSKSGEPLLSFRFEHVRNEDGHHIITGREGKLTRCEDEVRRFQAFFFKQS